uniref:Chitin-binding type-2 domain-containing protein n=1 Tax=Anopheles albimanus TaxID=7167 RepID=A0A182FKQ9_ANOAL
MMQTLVAIAIVVLLLVQTLAGATGVPVEEPLPVGERVTRNVVCEKVGRLPDYASTDCKTYYVCTPNTQGSLIAILSQCPSSSLFSLEQLKCVPSADYSCPLTTIEAEQTTTTIPSTTTTMATTTKTPEPGFICPAAGRFANPQSFDCGSYYLCTRNTDGSLIAIVVTCPGTSIFDPELAACVLAPHFCAQATVPTTETTIVTPGSTVGDGFVCPDEGRYADLESSDCSRYYMCLKSGGAIVATPAVCPLSTIFSPIVRQCVDKSTYACPSPTPAPTTRPPFPTTTTPVVIPTTTTPVAPVTTTVVTPRPTIPIIVPTTTTSRPVITTEVTTLPTEAQTITVEVPTTTTPAPVTTTEVTPQPTIPIIVPTTTTSKPITTTEAVACESYILCIINTLGTLTPLTFECPPTTIFSLIMKMCVPATTYNCGATPTDPAPTVPTSTVSSTTEPGPIVTPRPFVCPAPGRYTNPESIYCKTYYLCLYNAFGILDAVELSCPAGSIFAREVSRCEPDTEYECVTSPVFTTTETSVSTETTTTTEYPSSVTTVPTTVTVTPSPSTTTAPFQCTESGRYANAETTDCKTYKYCISVEGGFAQYTFTCPIGALFDADARVCSDTYVCPSNTEPFVCTGPGKFVNRDRNDCKTYKYCIAMVDGFTQHTFSCPNGALFDANTRLCSPTYICPLL